MKIARRFTQTPGNPYEGIEFVERVSRIVEPDGSVVFECEGVVVPSSWSQVATDVIAQKYFRKAGVPAAVRAVPEEGVPEWLWRSETDHDALRALPKSKRDGFWGMERDCRQVFHRLAGCWTYWAWKDGLFTTEEDAKAYYDEMCYMLVNQMAAPNSPQWFNTGLNWAYGISGPAQGHYYTDPKTGGDLPQPTRTPARSRTRASSAASTTTSSATAASWTSGRARRASSSTAPAPAPTSPSSAENESLSGGGKSAAA